VLTIAAMNRYAFTSAIAAAALVTAGCGSSDDSKKTAVTTTTQAAATSPPQALAGSYERDVTRADIERTQKKRSELGPKQEKPKPEHALLFIEPAGITERDPKATFVVQQDYTATAEGKLTIHGYQHPEEGAYCGPEVPQNATYSWKRAGDKLTLRAVSDPCADRDSTFTGTWTVK
jgi:hypothetical protein